MGLPGVRAEMLARTAAAAEALDGLFEAFGLRHLGLTPRHLVLKNGRPRLLDFGVAELIHRAAGQQPGALNPRYAPPELFEGRVHASADAYSLAVIYSELLTGAYPFRGAGQRNLASPARRGTPDVSLVPSADRAVLLTALHPTRPDASRTARPSSPPWGRTAPAARLAPARRGRRRCPAPRPT